MSHPMAVVAWGIIFLFLTFRYLKAFLKVVFIISIITVAIFILVYGIQPSSIQNFFRGPDTPKEMTP